MAVPDGRPQNGDRSRPAHRGRRRTLKPRLAGNPREAPSHLIDPYPPLPDRRWLREVNELCNGAEGLPFGFGLENPELDRAHRGLGAVRNPKLADDVLHVDLDGTPAYRQVLRDLGVGPPLRQQPQHLRFSWRDSFGQRPPALLSFGEQSCALLALGNHL